MKVSSTVSKILTNKLVLNIVSILALFNVLGYMVMGNLNNVVFFLILAVLVRYFSKNMIIVLGVPLVLVNLMSLKDYSYRVEGMTTDKKAEDKKTEVKKEMDSEDKEKKTDDATGTKAVSYTHLRAHET